MLRTFFYYLAVLPSTLFFSLTAIVFGMSFNGRAAEWVHRNWSRVAISAAGIRLQTDVSALRPGTSYVFMANHQSFMDIVILVRALKDFPIRFVAKQSLFSVPFFGLAMRRIGHVPIDRDNMRKSMRSIAQAVESARSGICIVIFPEGTRSKDYSRLGEFKIGGMILALKSGLPVAPVIIRGSGPLMVKNSVRIRPGEVSVTALPPLDATARYSIKERESFRTDLHDLMNSAYTEAPHAV